MASDPQRTFTGLERRRKTSWTVTAGDRIARSLVAVGGIGTIGAVLLVCVFLASEVIPLFVPAKVESTNTLPGAIATVSSKAHRPRSKSDRRFGLAWMNLAMLRLGPCLPTDGCLAFVWSNEGIC